MISTIPDKCKMLRVPILDCLIYVELGAVSRSTGISKYVSSDLGTSG